MRAALLAASAAPAAMAGIRAPRRAMSRPASGAHTAISAAIGPMVSPAPSADMPRTSCKYRVDRNPNPASAAMPQTPEATAAVNRALRNRPSWISGSARRGSR